MTGTVATLRRPLSLRTRIVILVLMVGLAPLAALGYWQSERTARTGERVLRERLREALIEDRRSLEQEWVLYRSRLLDLAELPPVVEALREGDFSVAPPASLVEAFRTLDLLVESVRIEGRGGEWRLDRGAPTPSAFGLPLQVHLPLLERVSGDSIGLLVAAVNINVLRGPTAAPVAGAVLTALDPRTGAVLTPVSIDRRLLGQPRFTADDAPWVAEEVRGAAPPVRLLAAAPLEPFASPFQDAGRRSLIALIAVLGLGLALAWLLSRRLTASLKELADGAAAVAAGDLSRTVPVAADDEVGRVGVAFNIMTDNLRRTLGQLAERESLAAVNEFAAALAHEVRNPLTAIQLDLQEVEERLPAGSELRPIQAQALADLRKLDRTVGGALEVARSGHAEPRPMDVHDALTAAARAARPLFRERGVTLDLPRDPTAATVMADPAALEQVFLNLLRNGAQAAEIGGNVTVSTEIRTETVVVTIRDSGEGITLDPVDRVFEPFVTTRHEGTGVGLAVARRIVVAHRGALSANNPETGGAEFRLELPLQ